MKWTDKEYNRFLATVAICCCSFERPADCSDANCVASYLHAVLKTMFYDESTAVSVTPLVYPQANKVPLVIEIADAEPRLLWFHPSQDNEALAEEVCGLLEDLIPQQVSTSA